jgi:multidrug efflux pump subunit AcrA (membrane-fusion protein)
MYPLEKAAELGFFNTVEEAMTLGKPDLVLESKRSEAVRMKSDNELKKLQFELEAMKSKQQINEETHKATIEEMRITSEKREEELRATTNKYKAELDQKQRLLEIEKEKALAKLTTEQEHARIKMDYESRSLDRKDTSDVLKYLPSLILGVGAAVVAFSSFLG